MSTDHDEAAYRRGIHQAFALAYAIATGSDNAEEIRMRLGLAEDAAQLSRNQPGRYDGGADFIRQYIAEHRPMRAAH